MADADIIVIGGGIAGMSAAAFLSKERNVLLLEAAEHLAYHSTGRSAAAFIHWLGNDTVKQLNALSWDFFSAPPEGFSDVPLVTPRGVLILGKKGEDRQFEAAMAQGPDHFTEISLAEAKRKVPVIRDVVARAACDGSAMDLDVDAIFSGFRKMFLGNSGKVITGAPVHGLTRNQGLWTATTAAGRFSAPLIVNAAGAWADQVAAMAGAAPVGLQPKKRSAAIIPVPEQTDVRNWPLTVEAAETFYCRPDAGRLMVSPADETQVEAHDAFADDLDVAAGLHHFSECLDLPVSRPARTWAGLRTGAPGGSPVAGFDPDIEGFFWLAGQDGFGIQTAPALARIAASAIFGSAGTDQDHFADPRLYETLSPGP